MAQPQAESLSVAEAKRRLRSAGHVDIALGLVRRHPYSALVAAFIGGVLSSDERPAEIFGNDLLRLLLDGLDQQDRG